MHVERSLGKVHILVLPRGRFPPQRQLPNGFWFVDQVPRSVELELLQSAFEHWELPYFRRFPGAREDSLIGVAEGESIVGLTYVGADNEIGLPGYGQLQYSVIRPEYRGRGLFGPMVTQRIQRAITWGVDGVVAAPRREGLPEFYERWGALPVGILEPARGFRRVLNRVIDPRRNLARRARAVLRDHDAPIR